MTLESIMNFKLGQSVTKGNRQAVVIKIENRSVRVQFDDTGMCRTFDCWELRIIEPTKKGYRWTSFERNTLKTTWDQPVNSVAMILNRSVNSVRWQD